MPQLQATFAKALRDPALEVRRNGVTALGLLAPLSTRLDALVTDLSSGATADDAPDAVAAACLKGELGGQFSGTRRVRNRPRREPRRGARRGARRQASKRARRTPSSWAKAAAALSSIWGVNYVSAVNRFKYR